MTQQYQPLQQEQFEYYRAKPDGDIDPAGEAGWYLQRQRETSGITLEQASAACGVHASHITGIELGDLTQLPPRSEALRMVGIYAKYLGFDPQPLVLHYAQFLPQPVPMARNRKRRKPLPLTSAKIIQLANVHRLKSMVTGAGGIVASVLAAVVVFQGAVWVFSGNGGSTVSTLPPVPQEQAPAVTTKSEPAKARKGDGEIVASITNVTEEQLGDADKRVRRIARDANKAAGGLSGLTELLEKDPSIIEVPLPKAKPVTTEQAGKDIEEVMPAAKPTGGTGKVHGAANKNSRLVLTARADVWIRIEDRQGNVIMTQTLRRGDSYRVPNRDGLIVIARDGGLIEYSIDGVSKGPLGTSGEILVGRPLDLSALAKQG